ncbi:IscS subfamily cysteine desulfurase [Litchfieldia alkalitelluris]|uniref:IscS subfamily cysteine desulfurase n=1 Tax=Litchfieldia alkalitelluris TaxID=304268 RepID=UPI000996E0DA|nr:IscS subfamily cysteine desulfurase [Litchfieldia alkalitelluris]
MIYLDYAATTPMSEEAIQVYTEVAKNWFGNTSSLHDIGTNAKSLLENCRNELAVLINAKKEGIYFTSGGTESNILALESLIKGNSAKGNHIITTSTEHSSLQHYFQKLESEGYEVTYLPVDQFGRVNIEVLENAIQPTTILASIQHANSEIGVVQDIIGIGVLLKKYNILLHCDCVQTFGKLPIDVVKMKIDSLSISSHKIYGPKGVGAVYLSPSVKWVPSLPNTTHENGFRPGTINLPGIAAFVTAAQHQCNSLTVNQDKFQSLRAQLTQGLLPFMKKIEIIESPNRQLPHIVGLRTLGIEGQYMMLECNRHGIAISTGSACSVGQQAPSKTMTAIGKTAEEAKQFIRISFGSSTSAKEIDHVISVFHKILDKK